MNGKAHLEGVVESTIALELWGWQSWGNPNTQCSRPRPSARTACSTYRYVKTNLDVASEAAFNKAPAGPCKHSPLEKRGEEYEMSDPAI